MSRFKQFVALVGVVVLSAGTSVAVAQGVGGDQPATTAQPAAPGNTKDHLLADGFQNEDSYVPITPCRILDTRKGFGTLMVGGPKAIDVRGDGATFAVQGGNPGGCGIPDGATAIEATVTAIDSGSGFLRAWPANIVQPNATFLNYDPAFNVSNTGAITLCGGQSGVPCLIDKDLSLQAYGSATHLVIDVGGFYTRRMVAVVNADGTLRRGNRVASATRLGTGIYEVIFDRNLIGCSFLVTPSNTTSTGYAIADPRATNTKGAFVAAYNASGVARDTQFYLEVTC